MEKIKVVVDFETRSPVDLLRHGRMRYITHPEADILMMGYRYVLPGEKVQVWLPGDALPTFVLYPQKFIQYAHNAEFEWAAHNVLGKKYGFAPTNIEDYECTMALCGRYGLPQALDKAGEILKLRAQKNPEGKLLIKLFCTPEYGYGRDNTGNILPQYTDKWQRFIKYCADDVEAEYELMHALPADHLSPREKQVWIHSCNVNARGIPVDVTAVKQIRRVSETYREAHFDLLPVITNNAITKITQTQRLVKYINDRLMTLPRISRYFDSVLSDAHINEIKELLADSYILMPNCQSDTVLKMLEQPDLPEDVMMLLEMRAALGLSSIGKYVRFQEMEYNGRCYDNQRYYGAHTGRWTGGGVQLLNLPRASVDDPEAEIAKYFDGSIVDDNPIKSARALIRPMIKAPRGKVIAAADYSSIEYVMLQWFAGEQAKLDRFAAGYDQYIDQAVSIYNVKYEAVVPKQRQSGKVVVLGCGYGQGAKKLVITADKMFGVKLTFEEAELLVNSYRSDNRAVTNMWYKLKDAAVGAIQQPGTPFATHKVVFKVVKDRVGTPWLALTLPSGRAMYYNRPYIDEDNYGPIPCHWGFHQVSKNWIRMKLIPGRITENIVQAAARDILVHGMLEIERRMGPKIIMSVYDEVVCELEDRDHEEQLALLCDCLCATEDWSKGIPLKADGFVGPRYKKM